MKDFPKISHAAHAVSSNNHGLPPSILLILLSQKANPQWPRLPPSSPNQSMTMTPTYLAVYPILPKFTNLMFFYKCPILPKFKTLVEDFQNKIVLYQLLDINPYV